MFPPKLSAAIKGNATITPTEYPASSMFENRLDSWADSSEWLLRIGSTTLEMIPGRKITTLRHWSAALNKPISAYPFRLLTSIALHAQVAGVTTTLARNAGKLNFQRT